MKYVAHRINTLAGLASLSRDIGAEIDIRADGSRLYLNHDPFAPGESLVDFLDQYRHGLLVLNMKEAGLESETLRLVRERSIPEYFLLDVELPFLSRAKRQGERAVAVRFSEDEPIELAERFRKSVDWIWVDTISALPMTLADLPTLNDFRSCLVCPSRWGRPHDIDPYARQLRGVGWMPTSIMTSPELIPRWKSALAA